MIRAHRVMSSVLEGIMVISQGITVCVEVCVGDVLWWWWWSPPWPPSVCPLQRYNPISERFPELCFHSEHTQETGKLNECEVIVYGKVYFIICVEEVVHTIVTALGLAPCCSRTLMMCVFPCWAAWWRGVYPFWERTHATPTSECFDLMIDNNQRTVQINQSQICANVL